MGELVTTPKNIVITPPTDQLDKDHVRFYWDDTNPYAVIHYDIEDSNGRVLSSESKKLEPLNNYFSASALQEIKTVSETQIWVDVQSKYSVENK